jgi:hypothetical protein
MYDRKILSDRIGSIGSSCSWRFRLFDDCEMNHNRYPAIAKSGASHRDLSDIDVSVHFMRYNYCRVYQMLRVTPAMQARLTDHDLGD